MGLKVWQIVSVYGVICPRAALVMVILWGVYLCVSLLLHKTVGTGRERLTLPVG